MSSPSWIDYMKSICETKVPLVGTYPAFMVNMALSYFPDTIVYANEMNKSPHIPPEAQYKFLLIGIPRRKRFSKWGSPIVDKDIDIISKFYGISDQKARQAKAMMTPFDIEKLYAIEDTGGRSK